MLQVLPAGLREPRQDGLNRLQRRFAPSHIRQENAAVRRRGQARDLAGPRSGAGAGRGRSDCQRRERPYGPWALAAERNWHLAERGIEDAQSVWRKRHEGGAEWHAKPQRARRLNARDSHGRRQQLASRRFPRRPGRQRKCRACPSRQAGTEGVRLFSENPRSLDEGIRSVIRERVVLQHSANNLLACPQHMHARERIARRSNPHLNELNATEIEGPDVPTKPAGTAFRGRASHASDQASSSDRRMGSSFLN